MSINNKKGRAPKVIGDETFKKCAGLEKHVKFQSLIKPFVGTCIVCRKGFTESSTDRDPIMSRTCSQSRERPICADCDKDFVKSVKFGMHSQKQFDRQLQDNEDSNECVIQTESSLDEQLTNTHFNRTLCLDKKEDEWVIIKFGENEDEVCTEKLFSIQLCNDEGNEECMIIQTGENIGEEEIRTFSSVKEVAPEEVMVTQDESTLTDIIQIGSLSFDNVYEPTDDSLGENISQTAVASTSGESFSGANQTWSVCTNKFTTVDKKLDNWSVCTKGFSIRGNSSLICEVCHKYFQCESDLKFHMLNHSSEKKAIQSMFHKSSKDQGSLEVHNTNHVNCDSYMCNICDKVFADATTLKIHMRIHSNSLPEFKKVPSKGISKSTFVHAGDKPFACTTCGTRFQHKHQLAKHSKTHMMLACKVCQQVFKSKAKLKKHTFQVCGKLHVSGQNSGEDLGNQKSGSHPCKRSSPTKHKKDSNVYDYRDSRDFDSQESDEQTEEIVEGAEETLIGEHRSLEIDLNHISDGEEFITPIPKSIFVKEVPKDIKVEDFEVEDFPMVDDYCIMYVKDESPNYSNALTCNVEEKVSYSTVRNSSSKR